MLIVDDERIIADTLVKIFSKSGYDARGVYSAEEALALIPVWTPNLAIIDVYLPAMNGIDLATRLKTEYPQCRAFLFSGVPGAGEMLTASGQPFEVIAKPVSPSEMLAIASRLLAPPAEPRHGAPPDAASN